MVTLRRLSDEISYSQPVIVCPFWKPRRDSRRGCYRGFPGDRPGFGEGTESVAAAYLEFATSSPALYEVMFSLSLSVPFDNPATPPELRFAFSQLLELFQGRSQVPSELLWASLHGIAEPTRTKRFPRIRRKERVRALVELFSFQRDETAQVVKAR